MREKRNIALRFRVTESELAELKTDTERDSDDCAADLSKAIRRRLFAKQRRYAMMNEANKHLRALAGISVELNLIARKAANLAHHDVAVEIVARLTSLERQLIVISKKL